jgi:predicted acyltransferase
LHNGGGYATLSFIPTLGTMLLGLIAGRQLQNGQNDAKNTLKSFIVWGLGLILAGTILHLSGLCPNVKRIWTPTWTLFSGGWCFLLLAFFYWAVGFFKNDKWYLPLLVIGANSIVAYVMAHTVDSFISSSLKIHLGAHYVDIVGTAYAPLFHGFLVLFFEWLILYWMF